MVKLWSALRLIGVCLIGIGVFVGCGGESAPPPRAEEPVVQPAQKLPNGLELGGRIKRRTNGPRPPFLTLSESAAQVFTNSLLGGSTHRTLIKPVQRGPFGPEETTLILFHEDVGDHRGLSGVVVLANGKTALKLPVRNGHPLKKDPDVMWVNGDHGWQIVLLTDELLEEVPVRVNQSFFWDGRAFQHDLKFETKLGGSLDRDQILDFFL